MAADVVPAGPYLPAAQGVPAQTLSELASDLEEYLPEVHNVQMLDEEAVEYDPATHFMQVEDVEAPVPAEYVPAAHSRHADAPSVARYVPAAQSWQAVAPDCAGRRMRIWLLQSSTVCSSVPV